MRDDELHALMENILFSKEAADYLGISIQRLNQLTHSGQIVPVKKGPSGSLYLKSDLDSRRRDVVNIAYEPKEVKRASKIDLSSPFVIEAINYYTLQSFYNLSDKSTEPIFMSIASSIDVSREMGFIAKDISLKIKIDENSLVKAYSNVKKSFEHLNHTDIIVKKGDQEYPSKLAITEEAPAYLFMRGNTDLLNENIVSVVGSREASKEGVEKAYRLSKGLGKSGIVVASGLARGIDTAAHTASIENKFLTIAVVGTPITKVYPKENEHLQREIEEKGLVVSQFPPSSQVQRWFFPMRNAVMSGISLATAIVEAGETSGALKQADYALKQRRLVFIPQSAIDNDKITWPKKYMTREGAHAFSKIDELLAMLQNAFAPSILNEQLSLFAKGAGSASVHKLE